MFKDKKGLRMLKDKKGLRIFKDKKGLSLRFVGLLRALGMRSKV